ncbi:MAG: hypothetical protein AB1482_14595 [Pseudomonadota bacterium]
MSRLRYFLIKCPNCGGRIDIKHDIVKRGEHPIYRCSACGTNLQWDTSNILWVPLLGLIIAGVVYVIAKPMFMGLFHLGDSGAEIFASIAAFLAVLMLLPLAFRLRIAHGS